MFLTKFFFCSWPGTTRISWRQKCTHGWKKKSNQLSRKRVCCPLSCLDTNFRRSSGWNSPGRQHFLEASWEVLQRRDPVTRPAIWELKKPMECPTKSNQQILRKCQSGWIIQPNWLVSWRSAQSGSATLLRRPGIKLQTPSLLQLTHQMPQVEWLHTR